MTSKAAVNRIIETLKGIYPDGLCSLQYKKDYELLFAVRLSAQCTDERVNKVTPALYARFPTLESFAEADPAEVGEYIHSCGFFRAKAKDIVLASQMLLRDYGGRVPDTMEELLKLPGVGRKTANVLGAVLWQKEVMPVDTHVFRVSERIGLTTRSKTPLQTELTLEKNIPGHLLPLAHHWLILHGRYVCVARAPKCDECGIATWCRKYASDHRQPKTLKI